MSTTHVHEFTPSTQNKASYVDTKSKIIITFLLLSCLLFVITFEQLILSTFLSIILAIVYKPDLKSLITKAFIPLPVIISLVTITFISYTHGQSIGFDTTSINYTQLEITFFFLYRSCLLIFISLLLISSEASFFEIIYGLEELKAPSFAINILLLMYRSLIDLQIEGKRMLVVRYSRNPHIRTRIFSLTTYKLISYMIGGIIVRAFIKNSHRKDALTSRGYTNKLWHKKKNFSFSGAFILWLVLIFCLVLVLLPPALKSYLLIGRVTT